LKRRDNDSGGSRPSPAAVVVAGLIVVAWVIVIALLLDFYFEWEILKTLGRFFLSWL